MQSAKTFYKKCKERCDRLMNIALHLNQTYMVLMQMRDLRLQKPKAFERSPAFYQTVFRNSTLTVFIEICKMYDANIESEGTYALLKKMSRSADQLESERSIEANVFNELTDNRSKVVLYDDIEALLRDSSQQIDMQKDTLTRLRTLRDKYYAHYEIMTEEKLAGLLQNNRITYEDIKRLIVLNMNILNALYKYFFDATMYPLLSNYDDLKTTVYCVEQVIEGKQRRMQALHDIANKQE